MVSSDREKVSVRGRMALVLIDCDFVAFLSRRIVEMSTDRPRSLWERSFFVVVADFRT